MKLVARAESRSQLGVYYNLSRDDGGALVCNCREFEFCKDRPKHCGHIKDYRSPRPRVRLPHMQARTVAESIASQLKPLCERRVDGKGGAWHLLGIAGAVRRYVPEVEGISIVACPEDVDEVLFALKRMAEVEVLSNRWTFVCHNVPGVVHLVEPKEFTTMYLWRTGNATCNASLLAGAATLGRKLTRHGVMEGRKCVASDSEEAIFEACGVPWLPPARRTS